MKLRHCRSAFHLRDPEVEAQLVDGVVNRPHAGRAVTVATLGR